MLKKEVVKSKRLNRQKIIAQHLKILEGLKYKSGLFAASSKAVETGYDKAWLRDNFYECLAFEILGDLDTVEKTYSAILETFLKHEYKIDYAIEKKPQYKHEYIHARFHPETFDEFWEDWGNKQNDSIGAILFKIGQLEVEDNKNLLNNSNYVRIVNKLVKYLESISYWCDKDSGIWEEDEEVHASSIGACVAGLKSISRVKEITVPKDLIENGEISLKKLLPRESSRKFVDLSLLSLIYPYHIIDEKQTKQILENVEYHLLRKKGVIRYKNDHYYNKNTDGYSEEAEWTFGLSWLAIIYEHLDNKRKAKKFLNMAISANSNKGMPELYFSNTDNSNENTPLGWSESLFIVALHDINKKAMNSK